MSVREAVERDLAQVRERDENLAAGALAATALILAGELDDPNSATSKSMCARELRETLDRLRELLPEAKQEDQLDKLRKRRQQRLEGRSSKTKDSPGS